MRYALEIARRGAALLVVGDETSTKFPQELKEFRHRQGIGIKLNLLVNYGWEWDLAGLKSGGLRSGQVSCMDLIVRWGGGRRLSGFPLPNSLLIVASMASWGHSAVPYTLQRGVPREPAPLLGFKLDEKRRPSEV